MSRQETNGRKVTLHWSHTSFPIQTGCEPHKRGASRHISKNSLSSEMLPKRLYSDRCLSGASYHSPTRQPI